VRVAVLNEHLYGILGMKFIEIHNMNIGTIFSSIYDQTIAELQLSNYILSCVPILKTDVRLLKTALDQLFDIFSIFTYTFPSLL
jgi:hypothetical protein